MEDRAAIARRLLELRIEHRDLDEVIARLDAASDVDDLQVRRLKKRKLRIKDQMNQLEHALIPDQPA
ncbi:MAG: YdcH family protein [Lysobacterales bacterium]